VARRTNSRLGCLEPLDPACSIGLSMCLSGVIAQGLWGPTGERLRAIQKRWGDSLHLKCSLGSVDGVRTFVTGRSRCGSPSSRR
jgi:hypothetical protein